MKLKTLIVSIFILAALSAVVVTGINSWSSGSKDLNNCR